jgi:hypothetical protein
MNTLGSWTPRRRARVNEFVVVAVALFALHSAAFLIASVAAKDLRYSRFFNAADYIQRSTMRDQLRLETAANFFDQIQANISRTRKNYFYDPNKPISIPNTSNAKIMRAKPDYCIGIPSVIQRQGHYILQLTHQLLTQLSAEEQQRSTVVVLGDAKDNKDIQALMQIFPVIQINHAYTRNEPDPAKIWAIDESYDYAQLLEECSKKATYTIILEGKGLKFCVAINLL